MQWITFCTLHYTLCRSADFNWITHCVIQRKITSNDNPFIPMHTWWSIMPCIPSLAFPFQSPCWNQKAWNYIHRTWIIRYKLRHCLRKKRVWFWFIFLVPSFMQSTWSNTNQQCCKLPFSSHGAQTWIYSRCLFLHLCLLSLQWVPTTSLEQN